MSEETSTPRLRASIWTANLLLLVFFGTLAYLFVIRELRFFQVPSSSMKPTLLVGDWIFTLNEPEYQRGDIIVLWDEVGREYLVKRIVGVEGDEISIEGGALFLNGAYASEPYIAEPMQYQFHPLGKVDAGQVLLLGDNRNESDDSSVTHRTYPVEDIIGRVRYIYYPLERRHAVSRFPLANVLGQ